MGSGQTIKIKPMKRIPESDQKIPKCGPRKQLPNAIPQIGNTPTPMCVCLCVCIDIWGLKFDSLVNRSFVQICAHCLRNELRVGGSKAAKFWNFKRISSNSPKDLSLMMMDREFEMIDDFARR